MWFKNSKSLPRPSIVFLIFFLWSPPKKQWKIKVVLLSSNFERLQKIINQVPYERHYNPLLIRNRSWILTIHEARILRKKPLEKTCLDFKKWVKSIQTGGCNGQRMVHVLIFSTSIRSIDITIFTTCPNIH